MKKYRVTALISAAAMTAALGGCGDKPAAARPAAKNPVTLTIWHYYNGVQQTSFDKMIKEFNDTVGLEEGIIAEAFSKSSISELADSVTAAVNKDAGADNPPDIFAVYSETAFKLDKMGVLADLNQYITPDEKSEYISEYISEGTFGDGTLKIFPTAKSTEVMMLNKTDWEAFAAAEGVSESDLSTIEGVTETAEKYYNYTDGLTPDIPNDGKAFFGRDSAANYMYIGGKQFGFEYVAADGKTVDVDKDGVKKLWENYYVPYVKGYFAADARFRSDDAKTGNIIALVCSTSGASYFPAEVTLGDESYPIENIELSVPAFAGREPYLVQQGAGMSVIKSDAESEYAAMVFLKWFTEDERNIRFSVSSGYLPVKQSANDFSKISEVNSSLETPMDATMLRTMETAIADVKSRPLYTSAPFDKSAETRDYIGNTMQDTAAADHAAANERISAGEDRETVLAEYTSDAAFDAWYDDFIKGLEEVISN